MFRLPEDAELEIQKKFPNAPIQQITQYLFQLILHKTLNDGACPVRGFGKFVSFKTRSNRVGQDVIRFKFKISNALINKLKNDQYMLNNIPVKAVNVFAEMHENKTKDKKPQSKANIDASKEAEKLGKKKTEERIVLNIINDMISKD
ncbi:MAG TPA: hypothetical protein PKG96_07680 [Bacilli bacterium]|nr:hypothetical protein [Bacilli bacterium]HOH58900.1 hypothetical protein [Bacilli bacterium]HQM07579.1 hypothetical protein [Bacilli bacterium]